MKHKILILLLIVLRFTAFAQEPKLMLPTGYGSTDKMQAHSATVAAKAMAWITKK